MTRSNPNHQPIGTGQGLSPCTLIFDFDQVLADTSSLAHLRDARQWAAYRKRLTALAPYAGVGSLVEAAHDRSVAMAIVSHSPAFAPQIMVDKEQWPIPIVIGWHDYRRRKPDPAGILLAIQRAGAESAHCYHIGDMPADTLAAKKAGVVSVAAAWGAQDRGALWNSAPDLWFETVEQFRQFVQTL